MGIAMNAGCITFEDLESRTESTVALAIHARHIKDGILAHTVGYLLLAVLSRKVANLNKHLRTPELEKCTDEQLSNLADLIKQLIARLAKIVSHIRQSDVNNFTIVERQLDKIEDNIEDLESIVENIYLAVNPEFHNVVSSAIRKLGIGVEERATLSHR